jgi:hypothetical protein
MAYDEVKVSRTLWSQDHSATTARLVARLHLAAAWRRVTWQRPTAVLRATTDISIHESIDLMR